MFIVAVTRADQPIPLPGLQRKVFRHGTWTITVGASSSSAQLVERDGGFRLVESPLAVASQAEDLPVAEVQFDGRSQELRVAKPLSSGRPIYFHQNSAGEFFCSTHVARLRDAGVRLKANEAALPEYLIYRYLVPPATLYESISLLPLGASFIVGLARERCAVGPLQRWSAPEPDVSSAPGELSAQLVRRLAARLQKFSPVQSDLAVLLSGGLDSTTLFRSTQELFGTDASYSTGFPFIESAKNTERQYAESAAAAFGSTHHYYECTGKDYVRGVLSAISAAEEPVHHLQSVLLYLLFERGLPAEKSVVISGEGADGIFGVELQRRLWRKEHKTALLALLSRFPLSAGVRCLTQVTGRGTGFFEPVLGDSMPGKDFENPNHGLWSLGAYGSPEWVLERFGCGREALHRTRMDLVQRLRHRSIYDIISLLGLMGEGAMTQIIWSKLGEGCGRFVDYSFLDPDLLCFVYGTSWETKLREPKALIRGALRRLNVPEFIIQRPKSSFGFNCPGWALEGGIFEPLVALASKAVSERDLRSLQSDDWPKASIYWALINYAIWKRLCIDAEPVDVLREELEQAMSDSNATQTILRDSASLSVQAVQ